MTPRILYTARLYLPHATAIVALACLVVATTIANAAPGVTWTSTTQLTSNGEVFNISVFPGKARYTPSTAVVGGVTTPFGDGTVLDYFVATGTNGVAYAGNYLAKGGTYINNPSNGGGIVNTPTSWGQTWVTSDPDSAPLDYKTGTVPQVGQTTFPLVGTINISTLSSGTLYVIAGSFSQSMVIDVKMTGPGQTQLNAVTQTISPGGNNNRLRVVRYDFDNSGAAYNTLTWTYNGGSNLARTKFYGVVLDGTIYVDTSAPTWVSTWPQVDTLASTSFTVRAKTNEVGTAYYVVLPSGAPAPTAAQVKAGNDASNVAALKSGSYALAAFAENTASVTGLTPSTAYDVWFVAQDAVPNLQASPSLVSVSTIAPDTTPPVWVSTWPQVDTLTPTSLTARVKTDEVGTAYFVVLASGAAAPTAAQVKAGKDASDATALKSGSMVINAGNIEKTAAVTGLFPGAAYDVWFVAQDAEAVPNLQAAAVSVSVTLPAPVGQYAAGTFTWGTDSVWATSSGGSYTNAWGPGNDAVLEGSAGTVSAAASGVTVHNITFSTSNYLIAGNTLTLSGVTSPTLTLGGGVSGTITSAVAGTVGFTKSGLGTLTLSSSNSFSGGIILSGGTIAFGSASSLNDNPITVTADTICNMPTASLTAGITLTSGVLSIGTNTGTYTTSGAVTGGGGIALSQLGGGATNLNLNSTANTFTGPIRFAVTAQSGNLTVNSLADATSLGSGDITLGSGSATVPHNFTYGSGATAAVTLDNRRFELTGTGATQTPTIKNNSSYAFTINTDLLSTATGTRTLTLGGTGVSTFGGKITNGTITTLNLIKADSGTWVLGGANTYNGTTAVNAGTLLLTGSIAGTVSVGTFATLAGNGTVTGAATIATTGILSPGNSSVSTLNFGSTLNLQGTSNYLVSITGASTNDKVVAAGAVTANGTITVTLSGYTPVAGNTFDLADSGSGAIGGSPTFDFTAATLTAGLAWDTTTFATDGTIKVINSDPYAPWALAKGLNDSDAAHSSAKDADPDGDGVNNLAEFAFNGDPLSGTNNGLHASLLQNTIAPASDELIYIVAVRDGAIFGTSGLDQTNSVAVDGLYYTIQGSIDLAFPGSAVSYVSSSKTAPVATGMPDLTSTAWTYFTFRLDASEGLGGKGFIRAKVSDTP